MSARRATPRRCRGDRALPVLAGLGGRGAGGAGRGAGGGWGGVSAGHRHAVTEHRADRGAARHRGRRDRRSILHLGARAGVAGLVLMPEERDLPIRHVREVIAWRISLTLAAGSILCPPGPTGCSEMTLSKTRLGLIRPLGGVPLTRPGTADRVAAWAALERPDIGDLAERDRAGQYARAGGRAPRDGRADRGPRFRQRVAGAPMSRPSPVRQGRRVAACACPPTTRSRPPPARRR